MKDIALKQNGKIIASNIDVRIVGDRFRFSIPAVPFINPNLPLDTYRFVFPDGSERSLEVLTSCTIISKGRNIQNVQTIEGFII